MRFRTLIILLLIIAGLVYGGLKGLLYYKVKQRVDSLVTTVSPFAYIRYGSIGTRLDGTIDINEIAANLTGVDDTVNIKKLRLTTPGLQYLLTGGESMRAGEFPEHLGLEIKGARFNLRGSMVQMLEKAEAEQNKKKYSDDLVCSLSRAFITAQYRTLGLSQLMLDSGFTIRYVAAASELQLKMHYSLRGIEQMKASMSFGGMGNSVYRVAAATPLLEKIEARYKPDSRFVDKVLDYCARQKNIDAETYIERLFSRGDQEYAAALGFIPGPGIRDAMRKMLENKSELRIIVNPISPLDVSKLHLYEHKDWPELLGLRVMVNGTRVSDLSFRIPTGKDASGPFSVFSAFAKNEESEDQASGKKSSVKGKRRSTPSRGPHIRVVSIRDIPRLIGKQVQILTYDGKRRAGHILRVEGDVVHLERRMSGGTFSTRVYVGAIKRIEVVE